MKKNKLFESEINEFVAGKSVVNCLRNRKARKVMAESVSEEMSLIEMFDERFKYRSDLRKMANDTTKEAYMIIRKEFGDSMWRQLGMGDCDERGLIDELNWMQETYGITNAQNLADVQLGRKSVKNFKKTEEQEQRLTAHDISMVDDSVFDPYDNKYDKIYDDVVWKLISAVWHYFEEDVDVDGFDIYKFTEKQIGKTVEQILDKHDDMPSSRDFKKCYGWVRKHAEEIIKTLETGSLENKYEEHPEFIFDEQEEEKIKLSKSEMEDLAFRLADYLIESFIVLEDQDEQYADLLAAVEKILEEDVPNPKNMRDCYNWCDRWYKKIEGITYSWYNDPNPLSYYEEQEEDQVEDMGEPWEIHYPTEKELKEIARLEKVTVDDICEVEICDHYMSALETGDYSGLDEQDERLLDEWCLKYRYLWPLTQNDGEFPEASFGRCDVCGLSGNVVPVLCVQRKRI